MLLRWLPILVGLLPLIGIHFAYWLSIRADAVPACLPYLDGCTSISSTGRHMPGSMAFRAALLPHAGLLVVLWWLASAWLSAVTGSERYRLPIRIAGAISAVALVVYVTFLGTKLPFYEFMRSVGIYFYFLSLAVAQLLVTLAMPASRLRRLMLGIVLAPWAIGIANLVQKAIVSEPNNIENRIEWVAALMMQLWFLGLYAAWRSSGFSISVRTDSTSADP